MPFSTSLAVLFFVYLQLVNAFKSELFAIPTTGTSGVVFSHNLLFSSNQGSAGTCAMKCFRTASCLSFTFTGVKEPGNCRGHNQIMSTADARQNKAGARSFAFPHKEAWNRKNCNSAADCGSIANVKCHRGSCVCTPPYPHFSESLNQCVSGCPASLLSSNFMLYLEAGINQNNWEKHKGKSEAWCKNACLHTTFPCLSVERNSGGTCYLSGVTSRTSFTTAGSAGWKFWQRNCK